MSMDFDLRLEKEILTKEGVSNELKKLGIIDFYVAPKQGKMICFSSFEILGFFVYLTDRITPMYPNHPSNIYDTEFTREPFQYEQILSFELNNSFDYEKLFENMMRITLDLMDESSSRALLSLNSNVDLCFFDKDNKLVINKNENMPEWQKNILEELKQFNVEEVDLSRCV